jgi:hypothetical protein
MEGQLFGGVPMNLELRLSVEDSPNSAGVAIDMIRCAKLARDRGLGGPIHPASAYFCKHPPVQMTDDEAHEALEAFIRGSRGSNSLVDASLLQSRIGAEELLYTCIDGEVAVADRAIPNFMIAFAVAHKPATVIQQDALQYAA